MNMIIKIYARQNGSIKERLLCSTWEDLKKINKGEKRFML